MKKFQIIKFYTLIISLFLSYSINISAQCSGSTGDLAVKALAVQPSSPQYSCGKATIIAEWEVISQEDYINACHLSTINLALPEPFLGTTGTITIVASDGGNYFEKQSEWIIHDNYIKIDLLENAELPRFEYFTLTVSNMDIADKMDFNNVPITMSTSHVAVDDNPSNDILTIRTSIKIADAPIITNIEANCSESDLSLNLSAHTGAKNGGAISTYSWTGPNGFSSRAEDPRFKVGDKDKKNYTGTYKVTVTDAHGCTAESSIDLDGSNCEAINQEDIDVIVTPGKNVVRFGWGLLGGLTGRFFSLERSEDGQNYTNIGEVQGRGTTSGIIEYDITDYSPLSGKSYYRLKQVDSEGDLKYSPVKEVIFNDNSDFKIFPNPVSPGSEINIQGQKIRSVKIYNMLGQVVVERVYQQPLTNATISTSNLSQGIYIAKVNDVNDKKVVIK